jgi:hypothetical protein
MIAVHPFGKLGPVLRLEDVIFHLFAGALANQNVIVIIVYTNPRTIPTITVNLTVKPTVNLPATDIDADPAIINAVFPVN